MKIIHIILQIIFCVSLGYSQYPIYEDFNLINLHLKVFVFDILGLKNDTFSDTKFEGKLKETVQLLIAMRNEARENKDFKLSDKIRDRLLNIGIQLKDGKEGTTFTIENK